VPIRSLPATDRILLFCELALLRDGIDALIITSPERHGGEPAQWYAALAALAERGVTVVIVTDAATADLLVALGARDALAREQKELQ
jgi:DNA invertase Pin-like site-specific DNA recombinase